MTGRADFLPRPQSSVCNVASSSCAQLVCEGDPAKWRSTHGDCASYGPGGANDGFCKDTDEGVDGLEAYKVCSQCQVCVREPSPAPTPAPTSTPTPEPTASPTPSPTEKEWDQLKHEGSSQVTCLSFEEDPVPVSTKYECQMRARNLSHSYFQYSPSKGTCDTGESCEIVPTTEDSEVYADPFAEFAVAGKTTLTLALPDFLTQRRLSDAPRAQAREERARQEETSDFACGPGRGGGRHRGCSATKVALDEDQFVPRELLLIEGGLSLSKSTDITSCPLGWKIFSPTSFRDWQTVKAGKVRNRALELRAMPVDVAATQDAPGEAPRQASTSPSWKTRDGSDWFMRNTDYARGSRYKANCYISVSDASDPTNIAFEYACRRVVSYLCQRQQVVPFNGLSYAEMTAATDWLASAIMATRSGLAADPFNLNGAQLLVSGYIQPRGGRRLAAGSDVAVDTTFDVAVDNAADANALDEEITSTVNDPFTEQAMREAAQENITAEYPDTEVKGASVSEPEVKVEPPPPTPAPTQFPTSSPTAGPTTEPTLSPTPHPTPVPRTHRPTAEPTAAPTARPSAAPTTAAPATEPKVAQQQASGGAGISSPSVGASGDPHLLNIHGQRFDLAMPGAHVLLQIPRAVRPEQTLVRVEADARALGGACADMYFQALNVTGAWARAASGGEGGLQFHVSAPPKTHSTGWIVVGKIDLKVVWGSTAAGIQYLNMYARHLTKSGYSVGGLLGEDDHVKESTPSAHCRASVTLSEMRVGQGKEQDQPVGSIAEAM